MLKFLILFSIILLAAQAYVYWHTWQLLPVPAAAKWVVVVLMSVAFAALFVGLSPLQDKLPLPVATAVYETGTSWIVILLYLFMTFLLLDTARLCRLIPARWLHANPLTSIAIAALLTGLFIFANQTYRNKVRQPLSLATSKPLERQLRIVLTSDWHIGYHNRRAELARWVDLINKEKADLILIAGDLIDGAARPVNEETMWNELKRLDAPVYMCLGNHEYLTGLNASTKIIEQAGFTLLRDSVASIGGLSIIGRDDRSNPRRKPLAQLAKQVPEGTFTILIDHQPYLLEEAEQAGIDFQFSGHTHRGQVWPISWITDAVYEKSFGSHQRGRTHYYVSSGLGIWGGKFRIGTRSEYVVLTVTPV